MKLLQFWRMSKWPINMGAKRYTAIAKQTGRDDGPCKWATSNRQTTFDLIFSPNLTCDIPVEWRRLRPTVTICLPSSTTVPPGTSDTMETGVLRTQIQSGCRMTLLFTSSQLHARPDSRKISEHKSIGAETKPVVAWRVWECYAAKCKKNKFFVIDHTEIWTNVKIATDLLGVDSPPSKRCRLLHCNKRLVATGLCINHPAGTADREALGTNSDDVAKQNTQEYRNHWTSQASTQLNLDAKKFQMETVAIVWSASAADTPTQQRCALRASSQRDTSSCAL